MDYLTVIAALVCIASLCSALFYRAGNKRLSSELATSRSFMDEQRAHCAHYQNIVRQIYSVIELGGTAGGLPKRLTEGRQIIAVIELQAPELLTENSGLVYWLHANEQFLLELANVARLNFEHPFHRAIKADSEAVFNRLYALCGLPAPVLKKDTIHE